MYGILDEKDIHSIGTTYSGVEIEEKNPAIPSNVIPLGNDGHFATATVTADPYHK